MKNNEYEAEKLRIKNAYKDLQRRFGKDNIQMQTLSTIMVLSLR